MIKDPINRAISDAVAAGAASSRSPKADGAH